MLYKKIFLQVVYTVVVVVVSFGIGYQYSRINKRIMRDDISNLNTNDEKNLIQNSNDFSSKSTIDLSSIVDSDKLLHFLRSAKNVNDFTNKDEAYSYFKDRIEKLGKDRVRLETQPQYSYLYEWGIIGEISEKDSEDQWEEVKNNLKKIESLGLDITWEIKLINDFSNRKIYKCDDYYLHLVRNDKNAWMIDPLQSFSSDNVDYSGADAKGSVFTPWLVRLVTNEKYFTFNNLSQYSSRDMCYDKRLSEFYDNMKLVFSLNNFAVTIDCNNQIKSIGIRRNFDVLKNLEETKIPYVLHIDCILESFGSLTHFGSITSQLKHCQGLYISFETKHQCSNFIKSDIDLPVVCINSRKSENKDIWEILLSSQNIKNNVRSIVLIRLSTDDIKYLKQFPNLSDILIVFNNNEKAIQDLINNIPNICFIQSYEEFISQGVISIFEDNGFIKLSSQSFIQTEEGNPNQIRYYRTKDNN